MSSQLELYTLFYEQAVSKRDIKTEKVLLDNDESEIFIAGAIDNVFQI